MCTECLVSLKDRSELEEEKKRAKIQRGPNGDIKKHKMRLEIVIGVIWIKYGRPT